MSSDIRWNDTTVDLAEYLNKFVERELAHYKQYYILWHSNSRREYREGVMDRVRAEAAYLAVLGVLSEVVSIPTIHLQMRGNGRWTVQVPS